MTVNCPPLFELPFHLVRYHLLTETDFTKVHRTVITVLPVVLLVSHEIVPFADLINEAVLILALKGTTHVLVAICLPANSIIFCPGLRQLLYVLLGFA